MEPLLFKARRILVYVENLSAAVAYYRDVLDFKPLSGVDGVNFEFATSGAPLVLHRGGRPTEKPGEVAGVVPSFQVESGIRELMERYRQRDVRIVREIQEVAHGWIAFIADLEGNVMQIYQAKEGTRQ